MASSASSSKSASPEPQIVEKKLKRKRKSEGTTTKEKKEKEKKAKQVVEEEEAVVEGAVEMDVDAEAEAEAEVDDNAAGSEAEDNDNDDDENADTSTEDPDVPVLSHAERRRQKKEAKLAAARKAELAAQGVAVDTDEDAEGASVKKRKLKDGSAKTVTGSANANANVRKNSVWVGNMSYKTQQDDLRKFFAGVGEITRVNMPMKAPSGPGVKPENRGFAYVDFATPEAKAAAITRSEQPLVGRKLLIKDGDSFEGRPAPTTGGELVLNDAALLHKTHSKTAQKILKAQKQPPASTLFMGNLGFETTDETIRQLLDAHRPGNKKEKSVVKTKDEEKKKDGDDEGKEKAAKDTMDTDEPKTAETEEQKPKDDWIRQIRMGTFEDTGLCKGFAFIDFTSVENATAALINPKNHHLNGRNLLVEYASPDAVRRGLNKFRPPGERTNTANQGKKRPHRTERLQARAALRGDTGAGTGAIEEGGEDKGEEVSERPKRPWEHKESSGATRDGMRHKGPKSRPKPGAALALAKRESVAIVASEGKKITF